MGPGIFFLSDSRGVKGFRKRVSRNHSIMRVIARCRGWCTVMYTPTRDAICHNYAIYVPAAVNRKKPMPLIVALHGSEGTIYEFALSKIAWVAKQHNCIVVCPSGSNGIFFTREGEHDVLRVIRDVKNRYHVDEERVYLLGISMGGRGTTYIGFRNSELFAAIAPIYGTSTGEELDSLTDKSGKIPVYAVHGSEDRVVPVEDSQELISRLASLGYEYRFKLIQGLGHDIRVLDIALAEILEFFQGHVRNERLTEQGRIR